MTGRDVAAVGGLEGGVVTPIRAAQPVDQPKPQSWLEPLWKPMGLDWLDTEPPPQRWLLRRDGVPVLASGIVGMLVAPGGRGKSMLLMLLAICVATGRRFLDTFDVEHSGRVVLAMGEEDMDEVRRRIFRVARALDLTPDERRLASERIVALGLAGRTVSLVETEGQLVRPAPLQRELVDLVGRERHELVILDPLSRFAPQVEGDNAAATCAVTAIEQVAAASRGTVLVAHHTSKWSRREGSKAGSAGARGVTALTDGVRWVASLTGENENDITLSIDKQNRAPAQKDPVVLVRDKNGVLRPPTGLDRAYGQVERAKAEEARGEAIRAAIVSVLGQQPGRGTTALREAVRELLKGKAIPASNDAIDAATKALLDDEEIVDRGDGTRHRYHLPEAVS